MEIRYLKTHKRDFENTGTQKDGTTIRTDNRKSNRMSLRPEVNDIINPYRRVAFT